MTTAAVRPPDESTAAAAQADQHQHHDLEQDVEHLGRGPRAGAGRLELEQHRLGRDDARRLHRVRGARRSRCGERNVPPWTSTGTSPATSRSWNRLAELTAPGPRRVADLDPAELDELIGALPAHVGPAVLRPRPPSTTPALTARLTRLVADASGVIYGTRPAAWQAVRTFFVVTYPAAVWDSRRFVMLGVALTFVPAIAVRRLAGGRCPGARRHRHRPASATSTCTTSSSSTTRTSPTPSSSPR